MDVWKTKDDKIAVLHGGKNAEVDDPKDKQKKLSIFDLTFDELSAIEK